MECDKNFTMQQLKKKNKIQRFRKNWDFLKIFFNLWDLNCKHKNTLDKYKTTLKINVNFIQNFNGEDSN